MDFEERHKMWLDAHCNQRSGERKGRLERGHQHGEILFLRNVWWPMFGHMEHLHPEYEITDWRGRPYYADFAWLPGHWKMIVEIKGYSSHVRDMDRNRYCEELNRETFLQGLGFRVVSFAYDDVASRPELCMTLLRIVMSRYSADQPSAYPLDRTGREIILLACQLARPLRPKDVEAHLSVNNRTAIRYLKSLSAKSWFRPLTSEAGAKTMRYKLEQRNLDDIGW